MREAAALGERRALTGEPLEPLRPRIAEARRLGILDRQHVQVMLRAFQELPPSLPVQDLDASERVLVDAARALHPHDLAMVARALIDAADPDGPEPDDSEPDPRREFTLTKRRDGWSRPSGMLDPELTAMLDAWLATRAKPRPEDPTGRDSRTAAQRRHDALAELASLALRADQYPAATGSPVTIHITMTADQFESKTGLATTGVGQRIRVSTAFRLAHEACLAWAVHDSKGSILAHGRGKRLATREQAEALLVRDGGCAFPGCDVPASWCERHHVWEWLTGGPTDIDTWFYCADITIPGSRNRNGASRCATASPGSSHHRSSTPYRNRYATSAGSARDRSSRSHPHAGSWSMIARATSATDPCASTRKQSVGHGS